MPIELVHLEIILDLELIRALGKCGLDLPVNLVERGVPLGLEPNHQLLVLLVPPLRSLPFGVEVVLELVVAVDAHRDSALSYCQLRTARTLL